MRRILCINDGATNFSLTERLKATEDLKFQFDDFKFVDYVVWIIVADCPKTRGNNGIELQDMV